MEAVKAAPRRCGGCDENVPGVSRWAPPPRSCYTQRMKPSAVLLGVAWFAAACGSESSSAPPPDAGGEVGPTDATSDGVSPDGSSDASGGATSGGAYFQLQGGDDPDAPGSALSCPDAGKSITIAIVGADGTAKLVVDGVGGNVAKCTVTASSFSVEVSSTAGSLVAAGSYASGGGKMQSTDATVTLGIPGASYKTSTQKCAFDFDPAQSVGGKLYGKFSCPKLVHASISGSACALRSADPLNTAFLRFAGCK